MKTKTHIFQNKPIDAKFIWIFMVSLTAVAISYTLGGKIIALPFGLTATVGVFAYAAIFACTDIVSEIYGYKTSRTVVFSSFAAVLIILAYFQFALWFPGADFWDQQDEFETVLGYAPRVALGGLISFLVSQQLDIWIFHKLKKKTEGRSLWLRNNVSTIVSQGVDTVIFITIAFYGVFPILPIIMGQYAVKLVIAIIDTPIVYFAVNRLRK